MTTNIDGWTDRLSDYLDDQLGSGERADMEAHLKTCAVCRATLGELQAVRDRAGTLGEVAPERDLWPGIAARIERTGSREATPSTWQDRSPAVWTRRFALSLPQLAAAALVVALLGGGSALLLTREHAQSGPARLASPGSGAPLPASFAAQGSAAVETDVDRAVADLEAALAKERRGLDPATAQLLDSNLATIDSALSEIRNALRRQPADGYLNRELTSTMLQKLQVLRTAVRMARPTT